MTAAPGWYPDAQGTLHYWNGTEWVQTSNDSRYATPGSAEHGANSAPQAGYSASPAQQAATAQAAYAPVQQYPAAQQYAPAQQQQQLAQQHTQAQPYAQVQQYAQAQQYTQAQQYAQARPYAQAQPLSGAIAPTPAPSNGLGVAGFVVGLVSLFMPLVVGIIVAGTGLGLSIAGMVRADRIGAKRGLAIAGLVLSIIGLVLII